MSLPPFATLLLRHQRDGTGRDAWFCKQGKKPPPGLHWRAADFAEACSVADRTERTWRNGTKLPEDSIERIETVLFGGTGSPDARRELYAIFDQDKEERRKAKSPPPLEPTDRAAPSPPVMRPSDDGIPRVTSCFLGRERDVAAILDVLLGTSAPVAILVQGSPGIGKTTLTQAIGNHPDVVQRFGKQNRWFVALDALSNAGAMQNAIAGAIGADPKQGFAATLTLLRKQPGLLVLDNLETPWDLLIERRATEGVLAALADIPGLALLASFRGRDHVGGPAWALVHPVAHLDPPYDAELFCRIAHERFPNDPALPHFITALGGIPLAIELVAKRAYGQSSLAALWTQWQRKGAELAAHPDFKSNPDRLTSLPHSIELSLASSRMTSAAWRLFRLLGQLPAGLDPRDRNQFLNDDGFDGQEALHRIGLATERHGRLDLLPPIREHAGRHHQPVAPDDHAWPEHYLTLTCQLGGTIGTKGSEGAVARLMPEFANIEASIRTVLALGDRRQAMNALHGFNRLTYIAALPSVALRDLEKACRDEADVQGEANCIRSLGDIALRRSDHAAARTAYEQAMPLYRQVGDVLGEANCIYRLGDIALRRSDHAAARTAYEQAMPLYRQVGDVLGEANCIQSLGDIALRRSDHAAARTAYEQAMPLYRQVGDVLGEANCIQSLGDIALNRSDHAAARTAYEQAMPLYRQVGDVLGEANCIRHLEQLSKN